MGEYNFYKVENVWEFESSYKNFLIKTKLFHRAHDQLNAL